mgnify:CR=1 FL=1
MGSFAFMCSCGCGLEVSPQYTRFEGECYRCGNRLQDGGVAVAFMPDGEHIVAPYEDYGEIGGLDLYAWVARANRPRLCKSMNGFDLDTNPEAFWEATRNTDDDDTDRIVGIGLDCGDEDYKYHIKIAFVLVHKGTLLKSMTTKKYLEVHLTKDLAMHTNSTAVVRWYAKTALKHAVRGGD